MPETVGNDITAAGRWIDVSLPAHEIRISINGTTIRTLANFSTGREGHLTPLVQNGEIDPHRRFREHRSSIYKDGAGHSAEMPFALFFQEGCAFHCGDPKVESHGCIHLARPDAEWLFNWVGN